MKLISRAKERNLARRKGEPYSQPWGPWELCEGAVALTLAECQGLIREWAFEDRLEWLDSERTCAHIQNPYGQEQFRVLPDLSPIPAE